MGLTNGAIAFFGKYADIIRTFPSYHLDYQRYSAGKERWEERMASDDFNWNGNVFTFYLKVLDSLRDRLPNPFQKDEEWLQC